jgi:hypothetical protein
MTPADTVHFPVDNYLRPQSTGALLRNTFRFYRRNFLTLFLTFLPAALPALILSLYGSGSILGMIYVYALSILLSLFMTIPFTVVISDICVGNPPNILRAYRRILGRRTFKIVGTILLQFLLLLIGGVLLVVPGIIFWIWFLFTPIIVVLERVSGPSALKRSKNLGKSFYLKTLLLVTLLFALVYVIILVTGLVVGLAIAFLDFPPITAQLVGGLIGLILSPLPAIAPVLLYYDLRVRKEAYDTARLAEDLRH